MIKLYTIKEFHEPKDAEAHEIQLENLSATMAKLGKAYSGPFILADGSMVYVQLTFDSIGAAIIPNIYHMTVKEDE